MELSRFKLNKPEETFPSLRPMGQTKILQSIQSGKRLPKDDDAFLIAEIIAATAAGASTDACAKFDVRAKTQTQRLSLSLAVTRLCSVEHNKEKMSLREREREMETVVCGNVRVQRREKERDKEEA